MSLPVIIQIANKPGFHSCDRQKARGATLRSEVDGFLPLSNIDQRCFEGCRATQRHAESTNDFETSQSDASLLGLRFRNCGIGIKKRG